MRFGLFEFDVESGTLVREGVRVRLQPQPARVLALLVERAGDVVSRDELRQRIWGNETFVDFERGLNFCIAQIRSALGDSAASPRFIETVPRRGYRFIAPVVSAIEPPVVSTVEPPVVSAIEPPVLGTVEPPVVGTVESLPPKGGSYNGGGSYRRGIAVAAVALLVVVGAAALVAGTWWRGPAKPEAIRVAVVPFDNETGEATFDDVARGVADATVARLAAPELIGRFNVIGNAAILRRPRDRRDLKIIGTELRVEYVVLGQVKRDKERVRLIAHLIRVSDQAHLWAETFDRPVFDLAVQAELAGEIARSVTARLSES